MRKNSVFFFGFKGLLDLFNARQSASVNLSVAISNFPLSS